jgi:hypothetical protein
LAPVAQGPPPPPPLHAPPPHCWFTHTWPMHSQPLGMLFQQGIQAWPSGLVCSANQSLMMPHASDSCQFTCPYQRNLSHRCNAPWHHEPPALWNCECFLMVVLLWCPHLLKCSCRRFAQSTAQSVTASPLSCNMTPQPTHLLRTARPRASVMCGSQRHNPLHHASKV